MKLLEGRTGRTGDDWRHGDLNHPQLRTSNAERVPRCTREMKHAEKKKQEVREAGCNWGSNTTGQEGVEGHENRCYQ